MTNSQKHQLHVATRQEIGKNMSQSRKSGQMPANVFGGAEDSMAVYLKMTDLKRFIADAGESTLLYLVVEDSQKEIPVLIDEVQTDPVTSDLVHTTFKRVRLDEKVRAEVPVEIVGEASVRGGNILLVKDVLEVEALPADLPEKITLDIAQLTEVGQTLTLDDAQFDKSKVEVVLSEEEIDEPLVIVQEQKEEVEVVAEVEPAGEEVGGAEGEAAKAEQAGGEAAEKASDGAADKSAADKA